MKSFVMILSLVLLSAGNAVWADQDLSPGEDNLTEASAVDCQKTDRACKASLVEDRLTMNRNRDLQLASELLGTNVKVLPSGNKNTER